MLSNSSMCAAGEVLLHQGREITSTYFILEGQVQLQVRQPRSSALMPHPCYQTGPPQQQQQLGQQQASLASCSVKKAMAAAAGTMGYVGAGTDGVCEGTGVPTWDRARACSVGPAALLGMTPQRQTLVVGTRWVWM
jgi:hypothetical protein